MPQHQVTGLAKSVPALICSSSSSISSHRSLPNTVESLVRSLADLLAGPRSPGGSQQSAAERLHVIAHDLPKVLSGPLLDLLATHNTAATADAASVQQHQQRLHAMLTVLEAELPRLTATGSADTSSSLSDPGSGDGGVSAGEGVLELLGEQDSRELLQHALQSAHDANDEQRQGLYEQLADIHHDMDIQRYLQVRTQAVAGLRRCGWYLQACCCCCKMRLLAWLCVAWLRGPVVADQPCTVHCNFLQLADC